MRKFAIVLGGFAVLTSGVAAHATPLLEMAISYRIGAGPTVNEPLVTDSGGVGQVFASYRVPASGSPFLSFVGVGSDIGNGSNYGTHFDVFWTGNELATITYRLTEVNLVHTPGTIGFKTNFGENIAYSSITVSNYLDNSNAAFGTGVLLNSASYTNPGANAPGPSPEFSVNQPVSSEFSITQIISVTLPSAGGTVLANGSVDSTLVDLPEPAGSLAMLGFGLVGLLGVMALPRKS